MVTHILLVDREVSSTECYTGKKTASRLDYACVASKHTVGPLVIIIIIHVS